MPAAIDTITATVTAAAAAGAAMAAAAGDSLTVRATAPGKNAKLLMAWVDVQTAGFFQIRSPRLHDNTRGLRFRTLVGDPKPLLPLPTIQILYEQDTLVLELGAGAVAGDIESASLLVFYEDLPGVALKSINVDQLLARGAEMVTVDQAITAGAGGGYTGAEALNAESDLLKANMDYALVGYRVGTECATVAWRGADTGNLRISGPGDENGADYTSEWFIRLSRAYNLPLIPVFNSANRAGILIDVVQDENAAAVQVTSIFVRLA